MNQPEYHYSHSEKMGRQNEAAVVTHMPPRRTTEIPKKWVEMPLNEWLPLLERI